MSVSSKQLCPAITPNLRSFLSAFMTPRMTVTFFLPRQLLPRLSRRLLQESLTCMWIRQRLQVWWAPAPRAVEKKKEDRSLRPLWCGKCHTRKHSWILGVFHVVELFSFPSSEVWNAFQNALDVVVIFFYFLFFYLFSVSCRNSVPCCPPPCIYS